MSMMGEACSEPYSEQTNTSTDWNQRTTREKTLFGQGYPMHKEPKAGDFLFQNMKQMVSRKLSMAATITAFSATSVGANSEVEF